MREGAEEGASQARRLRQAMEQAREVRTLPRSQVCRRFGYDPRLLPNGYLAERDAGIADLSAATRRTGASIGYPGWNLLYYTLLCSVEKERPVVVETGTNQGFSTIVLAQAVVDAGCAGTVRTVDLDPQVVELARGHIAAAGLGHRVEFHVGDSLEFLRGLSAEVEGIDFAFLDGDHSTEHVLAEFSLIHRCVAAARGKVFFDNAAKGGVAVALRQIRERYGGNVVEFGNCSWAPPGVAIWQP